MSMQKHTVAQEEMQRIALAFFMTEVSPVNSYAGE